MPRGLLPLNIQFETTAPAINVAIKNWKKKGFFPDINFE